MPNWKKVIVSGSSAVLTSVTATAGFTGSLSGSALTATSASFATTASYVNTLNQNVLITGSLTVGSSSLGSTENTLTLGPSPSGGTGEGGQLGLNASGGLYTSASFIDVWQNQIRILRGTNAGSDALVTQWNLQTKQMQLPAYTAVSSFPGTATANLAVDSGGNIITVSTTGGSVFPYVGNAVITGSLTTTGIIYAQPNGGMYFQGGDDAALYDINVVNTMGIYGVQDVTVGAIKLGSNGSVLYGSGSKLGLNTTNPSSASFTVNGNVWATSLTGSLLGTSSYATQALSASYAVQSNTSFTASYVQNAVSASYVLNAVSSSYALNATNAVSASYILNAVSSAYAFTSTNAATASYVLNAQTASYVLNAISSSYALNSTNTVTATNANNIAVTDTTSGTGPYYLMFVDGTTGNRAARVDSNTLTFNATTNLLTATASYANQAASASYALNSTTAATASYVLNAQTASYVVTAQTASYVLNAISASYARTASYVQNAITASYVLNAVSSSYALSASYATSTAAVAGTTNYVSKFTSGTTIGNSQIFDNGTDVGIGTTSPSSKLHLQDTTTLLTLTDTTYNRTSEIGYLDSANLYLANDNASNTYIGRYNNVFLAYGGGSVGVSNTNPTQLVDIGATGTQKALRVRGTYNFDGAYLGSSTSNGGAKLEFVAHTGVSTSSGYRIRNDRDVTPDLTFGYAASTSSYSALNYSELMRLTPEGNLSIGFATPGAKLHVSGSVSASIFYPSNAGGNYITGDGSGIVAGGPSYFYSNGSGGSYFEGNVRMRGAVSNDTATYLQLTGGTSGITYINGTLGVGTTSTSAKIDTNGSIASNSGLSNASTRPAVSAGTLTNGEVRGYSVTSPNADDGFLRVSAGGGTAANVKSYIDLSGYSTVSDMDRNIVFGTSGKERMRLTTGGDLLISGSLITSGSTGNGINTSNTTLKAGIYTTVDWGAGELYDDNSIASVNWFTGYSLTAPSFGGVTTVQWGAGYLKSLTTSMSIDWDTRVAYDNVEVDSINWDNRTLYDSSGVDSALWDFRQLSDSSTNVSIDWENRTLRSPGGIKTLQWGSDYYIYSPSYQKDDKLIALQDAVSSGTPSSDTCFGDIIEGKITSAGSGYPSDFQLVYLRDDGFWYTYNQTDTNLYGKMVGIVFDVDTGGETCKVLLEGHVLIDDSGTYGPQVQLADSGLPVYIRQGSVTGDMSTSSPSTGIVQVLGHCYYKNTTTSSNWMMKFRPSMDWYKL